MKKGVNFLLLLSVIVLVTLVPIAIAKNVENSNDEATLLKSFSKFQAPLVAILSIVSDLFENLIFDISLPGIISKKIRFPITGSAVSLPQAFVNTAMPTQTGQTITVNSGGNLQTALNNAQPGDTIVLQAGATFSGNFVLPNKNNPPGTWIVITTSDQNQLPAQGTRITTNHAQYMPKIISPNSVRPIETASGAHGYRLIGLEVTSSPGTQVYELIGLGSWSQTTSAMPYDLIIDRSWIHGCATCSVLNAISLNAGSAAVIDSRIEDVHYAGFESHGIGGGNGLGPWKVENNYIDGASINLIFGGAKHTVSGPPEDIEIKKNYFFKDPAYRGKGYSVKNDFELKSAVRVIIEGNIFENSWKDGQDGYGVVLKNPDANPAKSHSRPSDITKDITFRYNIIKNVDGGMSLSEGLQDTLIEHNIIEYGPGNGLSGRIFLLVTPAMNNIEIKHNVGFAPTATIDFSGANTVSSGFVLLDNIFSKGQYGIQGGGPGTSRGTSSLNGGAPGWVMLGNVIFGAASVPYPPNNFYPAAASNVGFINYNNGIGGNYTLLSSSAYKNAATDGTDPGANIAMVNQMTSGVVTGVWGACTDTSWSPATNTRCGTFTQVSNCGNTRTATGTLTCSGSTPSCGPSNICVQCTQNSQCATGQTCTNNACVTPTPPPTGALLLGYNFSEGTGTTTADYSGNSRTGTLNGTTWTTGKNGSGLSFNGILANVVTPDFNPPSSITMQAWIYPTNFSNKDRFVFSKGITEYEFRIIGASGFLQAAFGGANIRDYGTDFSNSANLNKWHHYAYTYDAATGEIKLYKDGILSNSSNKPNSVPADTSNSFYIGRHPTFTGESFQGVIDDVRIYNYARSQAQIQAEIGMTPSCTDSTWAPSEIGLCGSVAQVSNCGNTRVISGSVQCTTGQSCQGNLCVNTNGTTPGNGTNNTTPPPTGGSGGSGGGGGGGGFPIRTSKTPIVIDSQSLQRASPSTVNILSDFDPDTGIKQIEVRVIAETSNIEIVVSQYEDVPQEVSVQKSGKIYKYLQIETENLENNLDNAVITFQVEKIWVDGNRLDTDDVALFKFDETEKEWEELSTNFIIQDETYYYYQTTLESFSYFLIGQRDNGLGEVGAKLMIVFIVLAIILVWVVFVAITRSRKHAQLARNAIQSVTTG